MTASANKKHKKEVCRFWLNSRCAKGDACEFLHSIDYDKMPVCSLGDECDVPECTFKHPEDTRAVCANYDIGFCSFGRRCPHKHVRKDTPPSVSPYYTDENLALKYASLQKSSPSFRRKPCDYFRDNGWCPYFDMCNFVHS